MKYGDYDSHKEYAKLALITTAIIALIVLPFMCEKAHSQEFTASWYSVESLKREGTWKHGEKLMANGKRFSDNGLTAACRLYPLGTVCMVRNIANNKSITVTITDRIGKRFADTRIDLSKSAFAQIGELKQGLIKVEVTRIGDKK